MLLLFLLLMFCLPLEVFCYFISSNPRK